MAGGGWRTKISQRNGDGGEAKQWTVKYDSGEGTTVCRDNGTLEAVIHGTAAASSPLAHQQSEGGAP